MRWLPFYMPPCTRGAAEEPSGLTVLGDTRIEDTRIEKFVLDCQIAHVLGRDA